jgi:hypothetical protein
MTDTYCDTCGCDPCVNPSFCAKCREADAALAAEGQPPPHDLPEKWDEMSLGSLWEALNHPARFSIPQSTLDATLIAFKTRDYQGFMRWLDEHAEEWRDDLMSYALTVGGVNE